MSADEFWKDDPQLFVSYRTSFINRKKREAEEDDYRSWLTGLYIHDGNGKLFASLKQLIINMVSKRKDKTKIAPFPSKPYTALEKEKKNEKDKTTLKNQKFSYEEQTMIQGSVKRLFVERMKKKIEQQQNK